MWFRLAGTDVANVMATAVTDSGRVCLQGSEGVEMCGGWRIKGKQGVKQRV